MSSDLALAERLSVPGAPDDSVSGGRPLRSKSKRLRKNRKNNDLQREIERVEEEISKCDRDLTAWVAGDNVAMGRLFRIRTERLQLEAYLQGLRFDRP